MKKILMILVHHKIISIILVLIIISLVFFLLPQTGSEIETLRIKRENIIQSVITSGKIESVTSVKLGFLIPGKLVYLGAKKGDFVEKWQTIASLDSRTVQKNLQDDLTDYLKQRNSYDDTLENYQNRTPVQALNDDMKRILQNNQYDLQKSVYSVELQSLAKEQSYLVSPIDGIVTQADTTVPGVNVIAGSGFIVADPENVVFKSEVDEADIGKVRTGQPVKILLESYPEDAINLLVTKIDFSSHTSINGGNVFDVEAELPINSDYKYKIGMTGDAEIILSEKSNVLTVPLGSIFNNEYVYVKKKEGFEKRKIVPGIQSDIYREVISGLNDNEEIAVIPDEVEIMQNSQKRFIFF